MAREATQAECSREGFSGSAAGEGMRGGRGMADRAEQGLGECEHAAGQQQHGLESLGLAVASHDGSWQG